MDGLRQYAVSVVAAAFICGMILGLFQKSKATQIVKLICGVFMAVTVMGPITRVDLSRLADWENPYSDDALAAAAVGENLSRDTLRDIIKEETEAYILDKAAGLYAQVSVEVVVGNDDIPVPVSVSISGNVSPYVRSQLTRMITEDLGIAKENQLWIG